MTGSGEIGGTLRSSNEGLSDWTELEARIRNYLAPVVADADDRADVTQECLIKVWQRGDTYEGRSKLSSWLYRVVRNEFVSWTRRRTVREKGQRAWAAQQPRERGTSLDVEVLNRVVARDLLESMPRADRRVLELRYLRDWTSSRVGKELGLAPSSVRCRILRARRVQHLGLHA